RWPLCRSQRIGPERADEPHDGAAKEEDRAGDEQRFARVVLRSARLGHGTWYDARTLISRHVAAPGRASRSTPNPTPTTIHGWIVDRTFVDYPLWAKNCRTIKLAFFDYHTRSRTGGVPTLLRRCSLCRDIVLLAEVI